jgi:hypothetical protein
MSVAIKHRQALVNAGNVTPDGALWMLVPQCIYGGGNDTPMGA